MLPKLIKVQMSVPNGDSTQLPSQGFATNNSTKPFSVRDQDEGWFLARPDGSCAFKTATALGKAIERHQKACGVYGRAKRCHGTRVSLATNMSKTEEGLYMAKQQLRHKSIKTTEKSYAAETPKQVRSALDKVSKEYAQTLN